jgi:hypothetical protein
MRDQAVGRHHIETDAGHEHNAGPLGFRVTRRKCFEHVDLAGDIEVVGACAQQASAIGLQVAENGPAICSKASISPSAATSLEESESSKARYWKPSVSATALSLASFRPARMGVRPLPLANAGGEIPGEPGRAVNEELFHLLHLLGRCQVVRLARQRHQHISSDKAAAAPE